MSAVEPAVQGARNYVDRHGLYAPEIGIHNAVVRPGAIEQVARAYHALPEFDQQAVPAFHAMAHEVGRQFDHLTTPVHRGGMGFEVEVTKHDPYSSPAEMQADVARRRIKVLDAASTGSHPIFSDDQNNMFRAVHDVFGHAGTGRGFDRHGEEAAYRKHATMFTPLARQALATETRGQNHAMLAAGGEFPVQKVGILPAEVRRLSFTQPRTPAERVQALAQARQFHQAQGL